MGTEQFDDIVGKKIKSNLEITTEEKYPGNPEYANNVDGDYTNAIGDAVEAYVNGEETQPPDIPQWDSPAYDLEIIEDGTGLKKPKITLHWIDTSSDILTENFLIYKTDNSGGTFGTLTLYDKIPADETDYVDEKLSFNTGYRYAIRAEDRFLNRSDLTDYQEITTPTVPEPSRPTDKIVTGAGVKQIGLKFQGSPSFEDILYYQVESRSATADPDGYGGYEVPASPSWGDWEVINQSLSTRIIHENLDYTKCYQYRYRSVNSYGVSGSANSEEGHSELLSDIVIPLKVKRDDLDWDIQDQIDGKLDYYITHSSQDPKYHPVYGWPDTSKDDLDHHRDIWYQIDTGLKKVFNGYTGLWENQPNITKLTIADDNVLTPSEKLILKKEWNTIAKEKIVLLTQFGLKEGEIGGVETEKYNYISAYNTLDSYLNNIIDGILKESNYLQVIEDIAGATARDDGFIFLFFQDSTPTANGAGDLWINTEDELDILYKWNGSNWIEQTGVSEEDRLKIVSLKQTTGSDDEIVIYFQDSEPSIPASDEDDLWVDTDGGDYLYRHTSGGTWEIVESAILDINGEELRGKFRDYYDAKQELVKAISDVSADDMRTRFVNNTYMIDIENDKIDSTTYFVDFINNVTRTSIKVYSVKDEDKNNLTGLQADDLLVATDTFKEYRYNGASWEELTETNTDFLRAFIDADHLRTIYIPASDADLPSFYQARDLLIPTATFSNNDGSTTKEFQKNSVYITTVNEISAFNNAHWGLSIKYTDDTLAKYKTSVFDSPPNCEYNAGEERWEVNTSLGDSYVSEDIFVPGQEYVIFDGSTTKTFDKGEVYVASIADEEAHRRDGYPFVNTHWERKLRFSQELDDITEDNKLSPTEKLATKKEWEIIRKEYPSIIEEAVEQGVNTFSFKSAYDELDDYLNNESTGLLNDTSTTSDIVGDTFRSKFSNYYDEKAKILRSIAYMASQDAYSGTDYITKREHVGEAVDDDTELWPLTSSACNSSFGTEPLNRNVVLQPKMHSWLGQSGGVFQETSNVLKDPCDLSTSNWSKNSCTTELVEKKIVNFPFTKAESSTASGYVYQTFVPTASRIAVSAVVEKGNTDNTALYLYDSTAGTYIERGLFTFSTETFTPDDSSTIYEVITIEQYRRYVIKYSVDVTGGNTLQLRCYAAWNGLAGDFTYWAAVQVTETNYPVAFISPKKYPSLTRPKSGWKYNFPLQSQMRIKMEVTPWFNYGTSINHRFYEWYIDDTHRLILYYEASDDKICIYWRDGGTVRYLRSPQFDDSTSYLNINQRLKIDVAFDPNGSGSFLKIYDKDDNLLSEDTTWDGTPDTFTSNFNNFYVGQYETGLQADSEIHSLQIWSGALTDTGDPTFQLKPEPLIYGYLEQKETKSDTVGVFNEINTLVSDSENLTTANWVPYHCTTELTDQYVEGHRLTKLTATSANAQAYQTVTFTSSEKKAITGIVRKGNYDPAGFFLHDASTSTNKLYLKINFSTKTITGAVGSLIHAIWLDNKTVQVYAVSNAVTHTNAHRIYCDVDGDDLGSAGDYTYWTAVQVYDNVFPYSYTPNDRDACFLQTQRALTEKHTIECKIWPFCNYDTAGTHYIASWYVDSNNYYMLRFYSAKIQLLYKRGTGEAILESSAYTSQSDWNKAHDIAIIADLGTGDTTGTKLIIDGVIVDETWSGNIDSFSPIFPTLTIGSKTNNNTEYFEGFIWNLAYTARKKEVWEVQQHYQRQRPYYDINSIANESDTIYIDPYNVYIKNLKVFDSVFFGRQESESLPYFKWDTNSGKITINKTLITASDSYNYWDLDTGGFRVGNASSYIYYDPSGNGSLTLKMDAIYASTLETLVNGKLSISMEGDLTGEPPSLQSPIYVTTEDTGGADPAYGIISHLNEIRLRTGNADPQSASDAIVIDNNQNVGIGTTSPSALLEIKTAIAASSGLLITGGASSSNALKVAGSAGDGGGNVVEISPSWNTNNGPTALLINPENIGGTQTGAKLLDIQYDGSSKLMVDKSGNVGIGTPSPESKLQVIVPTAASGLGLLISTALGTNYDDTSIPFRIIESAGTLFTVQGNGNVGIGTTGPGAKLEVKAGSEGQSSPVEAIRIWGPNSPTNMNSAQDLKWHFASAGSAGIRAYRGGSWNTYLQFLTNAASAGSDNPQVRMTIDDTGNVGIGTSNPSQKLYVSGNIQATGAIIANTAGSVYVRYGIGDPGSGNGKLAVYASTLNTFRAGTQWGWQHFNPDGQGW